MFRLFKPTAKVLEARKAEEALEDKMSKIELFPGNLAEFEGLKGVKYELVDVPGNRKFLIGGFSRFRCLKCSNSGKAEYRDIAKRAVELDAEAIIRYTIVNNTIVAYKEMGIPVKRKQQ